MRYVSFAVILVFLICLPPKSKVVDVPICEGICMDAKAPDEVLLTDDGRQL